MKNLRLHIPLLVLFLMVNFTMFGQQRITFKIKGKEVFQTLDLGADPSFIDSCLINLGFDSAKAGLPKPGTYGGDDWYVVECTKEILTLKRSMSTFNEVDMSPGEIHIDMKSDVKEISSESIAPFGYNRSSLPHIQDLRKGQTRFFLKGFQDANEVYLSGNFCQWSTLRYPMIKSEGGWVVEVDLDPGVWGYKFVVDGMWHLDPQNEASYFDAMGYSWRGNKPVWVQLGNENSVYVKANQRFILPGHQEAEKVLLAGDFNDWSEKGTVMNKTNRGWEISVYLSDGTYPYKFIVDGRWMTDPTNPVKVGRDDYINSVKSVGANQTFLLEGYTDAKEVRLSGSFNGWADPGYTMEKTSKGWEIKVHLPKGKQTYRYVVDGKWMHDESNPQKEHNEYGEYNSVIWKE